jgi:hypothetical protein
MIKEAFATGPKIIAGVPPAGNRLAFYREFGILKEMQIFHRKTSFVFLLFGRPVNL